MSTLLCRDCDRGALAAVVALAALGLVAGLGCGPTQVTGLRLAEVGPFSATIEWTTAAPEASTVQYGEGTLLDREAAETQAATEHRLVLAGLKPGTVYSYRVDFGQGASFRSAPGPEGAFDLVVLDDASPSCRADAPKFEAAPDLAVLAGPCNGPIARNPQSILTVPFPSSGVRTLRYGRSRVLVARDLDEALAQPVEQADQGFRTIVVLPSLPQAPPDLAGEGLLLSPRGAWHGGRRVTWDASSEAWFEVDSFEVAQVRGGVRDRERTVIVEAPPETKKSCLYCDRLMESGRYEQSIAWYREFIRTNRDRHAVEDAVLAIAEIEDEKLFRYPEALAGFKDFLRRYPDSRRGPVVRYRIDYLRQHADHGYKPLEAFERAKAELVRAAPLPTVEKVERLVSEYPDSTTARDALFWLGHALGTVDPTRAARHYETLIARFPRSENAAMAAIAVGDLLYQDKRYRAAILAYTRAASIAPETYAISLADKLSKSHRNIYREIGRWLAWVTLGSWGLATLIRRPRPRPRDLVATLVLALAYGAAAGAYFAVRYERAGVMIPTISALGAASCGVFLWNRVVSGERGWRPWVVAAHAVTCPLAAAYLILYSFHYLYPFGV